MHPAGVIPLVSVSIVVLSVALFFSIRHFIVTKLCRGGCGWRIKANRFGDYLCDWCAERIANSPSK